MPDIMYLTLLFIVAIFLRSYASYAQHFGNFLAIYKIWHNSGEDMPDGGMIFTTTTCSLYYCPLIDLMCIEIAIAIRIQLIYMYVQLEKAEILATDFSESAQRVGPEQMNPGQGSCATKVKC